MNKSAVVRAILDRLRADLLLHTRAAATARAEATDEQSKAENKYDTRGLEASYLARGQSRQATEIRTAMEHYEALLGSLNSGTAATTIGIGSLVELRTGREKEFYFVGPKAGGLEVSVEDQEVVVLSPQSPLGQRLLGHGSGEVLPPAEGERAVARRIVAVS